MTTLYCDVHGTIIGGPYDPNVFLQALQDVSPEYVVRLVSGRSHEASLELGVQVLDKVDLIRNGDLKGAIWIDDDELLLRALPRRGVTAVHVDDALEFLAGIRRPPRENPRQRQPQRTAVWYEIVTPATRYTK